jgi:hypothetical protein
MPFVAYAGDATARHVIATTPTIFLIVPSEVV